MQKVSAGVAFAITVLLLVVGGAYLLRSREGNTVKEEAPQPVLSDSRAAGEEQTTVENIGIYAGTRLAGSAAPLLDFSKTDYEKAKASDKLVVLYFYANWCPICKVEVRDSLFPAFNVLTDERVIGFRVNYNDGDTDADEKALAREFGVGYYQHTKVFLKDGRRILKSPESWDKERYLSEIGKALSGNP